MDPALLIGGGVALVAVAALAVWRHPVLDLVQRSSAYIQDVRAEVRKVSWPTWDDLRKSTGVIIVIILIIGAIIGLMDLFFSKLLIGLLGRLFGG